MGIAQRFGRASALALAIGLCGRAALAQPAETTGQDQSSSLAHQESVQADGRGLRQPADGTLEEVVVTARRREETLQSVPAAVSALKGARLAEIGAPTVADLQAFIPNVVLDQGFGNPGNTLFFIRGVGTQEVERSFDPAVGVILDGVYLSNSQGALLNTFDIDQIEVLRGPQGTLFGKNTTGGVINVTRSRPTGEFGLRYEITGGSYAREDVKLVANAPIVPGVLAAKVGFARLESDYYLGNLSDGGRRPDGTDITDVTATVLFTPRHDLEALLTLEHVQDSSIAPAAQNLSGAGNSVNPAGELVCTAFGYCGPFGPGGGFSYIDEDVSRTNNKQNNATLQVKWTTPIGVVTSVSGYREAKDYERPDVDASPAPLFTVPRSQVFHQASEELRLNSKIGERVDLVVGAFLFTDEYRLNQRIEDLLTTLAQLPPGSAVVSNERQERDSYAGFAQADIKLWRGLSLTLGGRYTFERKKFSGEGATVIPAIGASIPIAAAQGRQSWDEFTPKVGLNWQIQPDVLAYYSYSEGYRSGGFNGRNFTPASIGPYDPENVDQHEIGIKSTFFEKRIRANLAFFYSKYNNIQEDVIQADPVQSTSSVVLNAANATLYGVEGEFSWATPVRGLTAGLNFGYLHAAYDSFCADLDGPYITNPNDRVCGPSTIIPGGGVLTPVDNAKLRLRRTPEWEVGVNGRYVRPVGPGSVELLGDYHWTDDYQQDTRNDPRGVYPAQGILNLSAGYSLPFAGARSVKLSVFGRNITDERAFSSFTVAPPYLANGYPTIGATWGVTLSGQF